MKRDPARERSPRHAHNPRPASRSGAVRDPSVASRRMPDSLPPPASTSVPLSSRTRSSPAATSLRAWQRDALAQLADWRDGPFLVSAAPGAGKTRPALELAKALLAQRAVARVAVLCPTTPLTRQWAAAAAALGVQLEPDPARARPPRDFHGVAVTYARIASDPRAWAAEASRDMLVIVDEAHHLGEELAWGEAFQRAFAPAPRWLLLSGTPFRSDATPIPGVRYDAEGLAVPDVSYTYAQAVADGICRPVAFVTFDGTLSWRSGDDVIESSFETVLTAREAARRYRTAISTDLPDGLPRILREADAKLRALRAAGQRDAGGLVVAADSAHARRIAKLLGEATGRAPLVVLHTEARAARKLTDFRGSREPWIVAVNMVSEGVDIPRLRVGVYATAAKTPLIFRQIVGRFVRTIPGRPPEPSWVYLPADPILRRHASEVETELRHALRAPDDLAEELDEPRERRATEPSPTPEFVPLSAEFAPQMTLFGPAPGATAAVAAETATTGSAHGAPQGPPPRAAFERRQDLRAERSRLVADLQRRGGGSHREINAWLNRAVGVQRVETASIPQLERSIAVLVKELTRRTRM
ncbi:MAG TPA: DEAD/DEAH box helicase family protein [Solirubrobacteraceae bacterium]|jgi:superfamily II DNA or RNA helicase|nr:DEAD/DEAH box helicase family protein [Solirubrobacteraceae bacterium]